MRNAEWVAEIKSRIDEHVEAYQLSTNKEWGLRLAIRGIEMGFVDPKEPACLLKTSELKEEVIEKYVEMQKIRQKITHLMKLVNYD